MKKIFFTIIILAAAALLLYQYRDRIAAPAGQSPAAQENPSATQTPPAASGSQLDLSGRRLGAVPSAIFKYTFLETLNLSNNELTGALPAEIRHLQNLKYLYASNNKMTGIPAEIGQLGKLEVLDYGYNYIDTMPNEIANLKNNLKKLILTGNPISSELQVVIKSELPNTEVIF